MQGRDQNHENKHLQLFQKKCTLKIFEKIGTRKTVFGNEIKN